MSVWADEENDWSKGSVAPVDANGAYAIRNLSAGSYRVSTHYNGAGLPQRFFGIDGSHEKATVIKLADGQSVVGKNIAVVKEATISGKLTAPLGVDLGSVGVRASWLDSLGRPMMTSGTNANKNGAFTLVGLPAGAYKIEFRSYDSGAVDQWYKNASTPEKSPTITVKAGQKFTGVNDTLVKGATISGKVTATAGMSPAGSSVSVWDAVTKAGIRGGSVAADGSYKIVGIPQGTYKVEVNPRHSNVGLATGWYKNASFFDKATPLVLAAGASKTGIDVALAKGGAVSGKISASGVAGSYSVDVYDSSGQNVGGTYSDSKGNYSVQGLATGSYKVAFNRASGASLAEAQYYDNKAESEGLTAAKALTVTAGKTLPGINANLRIGGTITGTLLDSEGKSLAGITVAAQSAGGVLTARTATTDKAGKFAVSGLSNGSYMLVANPYDIKTPTMPGSLYSGNVTVMANAKPIAATVGKSVSAGTLSYKTATTGTPKALTAGAPTITGTTVTGQKLTAKAGTWGPAPVALNYQWKRNGVAISNATASTYVLTTADVAKKITVTVTGSKAGYVTAAKTSAATAAVTAPKPVTAVTPTISGTTVTGQKLTAKAGTWGPAPVSLKYQWKRNGVAISNATASTYVLRSADAGTKITVTVTGSKTGYVTAAKTSATSKTVTAKK